ncbi:MAG: phosphatase [Paludibacteraceae bacterium]|jgi:Histidinol phosphatase and related hydrolases of the PHP family|nr:phosphatase [Paludibacteraceae bacterium]MCR5497377.1 phosphatase [Paludibacteraceae bacterium]
MKVALDVHTHTIVSGHAYSTIQEMAKAAAEKGLQILGMAEHGPTIKGACDAAYFNNLSVIPEEIYGVKILVGAEINILDTYGSLDLSEKSIRKLKIRIAGIHHSCYRPGTVEENTDAVIGVMKNPLIDIISHPADGTADLDYERLVQTAKETRAMLEINNSSLSPSRGKEKAWECHKQLLTLCKKYELMVIMGSDAHISFDVARYDHIYRLLQEVEFPEALLINDKPDLFWQRLQRKE